MPPSVCHLCSLPPDVLAKANADLSGGMSSRRAAQLYGGGKSGIHRHMAHIQTGPTLMSDAGNSRENSPQERRRLVGRPWPKGVSGNPSGRPKKKPITLAAEKMLGQKIPSDHALAVQVPHLAGKTWADAIAYGQVLEAVKGGTAAAKELADRVEGRVEAGDSDRSLLRDGGTVVNIHIDAETGRRMAEIYLQRHGESPKALPEIIETTAEESATEK